MATQAYERLYQQGYFAEWPCCEECNSPVHDAEDAFFLVSNWIVGKDRMLGPFNPAEIFADRDDPDVEWVNDIMPVHRLCGRAYARAKLTAVLHLPRLLDADHWREIAFDFRDEPWWNYDFDDRLRYLHNTAHTVYGKPDRDIPGWTKEHSITDRRRALILERDKFCCQRCGARAPRAPLHIDHIVPRSKGGKNIPRNLQTLCESCNMGKLARDPHLHDINPRLSVLR